MVESTAKSDGLIESLRTMHGQPDDNVGVTVRMDSSSRL